MSELTEQNKDRDRKTERGIGGVGRHTERGETDRQRTLERTVGLPEQNTAADDCSSIIILSQGRSSPHSYGRYYQRVKTVALPTSLDHLWKKLHKNEVCNIPPNLAVSKGAPL